VFEYGDLTVKNPSSHWSFSSDGDSNDFKLHKVLERKETDAKWVRLSKNEEEWRKIADFKSLEELHLYSPSDEQIELISTLKGIKRLSINSYRPRTIDFLSKMNGLEELSLNAVSGFDDLTPISSLSNLKALNLDLLRRVKNFSPLFSLKHLKFLRIIGNFDFNQPINDLHFVIGLQRLEYLVLNDVRIIEKENAASPLAYLKSLLYLGLPGNAFSVDEYAFIAEALKGVEGAEKEPVVKYIQFSHGNSMWGESVPWQVPDEKVDHIDMHRPLKPAVRTASGVVLALDGLTDIGLPSGKTGHMILLGRGSRSFQSTLKNAEKRCLAHIEKYHQAKLDARIRLKEMDAT